MVKYHPDWVLGFLDETWWSRFAQPMLHAWCEEGETMQLVEQTKAFIQLADGTRRRGVYAAVWDGRDAGGRPAANGVYFVRVTAGGHHAQRRIVLTR